MAGGGGGRKGRRRMRTLKYLILGIVRGQEASTGFDMLMGAIGSPTFFLREMTPFGR